MLCEHTLETDKNVVLFHVIVLLLSPAKFACVAAGLLS